MEHKTREVKLQSAQFQSNIERLERLLAQTRKDWVEIEQLLFIYRNLRGESPIDIDKLINIERKIDIRIEEYAGSYLYP